MTKNKDSEKLIISSTEYITRLSDKFKNRKEWAPANLMMIESFIPGTIVEILVSEGEMVEEGDIILVLEAMKMKNRIKSGASGRVRKIYVNEGDKVPRGELLLELE